MNLWESQVVPRMVDFCCGMHDLDDLRERACEGLHGEVLEIGFGSGLNIPYYPSAVRRVTAIEPSDVAWRLARRRIEDSGVEVVRGGLDGQQLDLPDASFDAALSTFTMCTIPDLNAALSEIRRVLRPGGQLHFVEHGLSPESKVERWQHRLTPVQRRVAGGCHLDRPIAERVEGAGFVVDEEQFYAKGPKAFSFIYLGRARVA